MKKRTAYTLICLLALCAALPAAVAEETGFPPGTVFVPAEQFVVSTGAVTADGNLITFGSKGFSQALAEAGLTENTMWEDGNPWRRLPVSAHAAVYSPDGTRLHVLENEPGDTTKTYFLQTSMPDGTYLACEIDYDTSRMAPSFLVDASLAVEDTAPVGPFADANSIHSPYGFDDGILVIGPSGNYDPEATEWVPEIIWLNAEGETQWESGPISALTDCYPQAVARLEDGFAICGANVMDNIRSSMMVAKISDTGELIWQYQHEGDGSILYDVQALPDGGVLATGYTDMKTSYTAEELPEKGVLVRLDASGKAVFEQTYVDEKLTMLEDIEPLNDGTYAVTARKDKKVAVEERGGFRSTTTYLLIQFSEDGEILGTAPYNPQSSLMGWGVLASGPEGEMYLFGNRGIEDTREEEGAGDEEIVGEEGELFIVPVTPDIFDPVES